MTNKEAKQFCIKQIFGEDISGEYEDEFSPKPCLKSENIGTYQVYYDYGYNGFIIGVDVGMKTILISCWFPNYVPQFEPRFAVYKGDGLFYRRGSLITSGRYRLSKMLTKKLCPYI